MSADTATATNTATVTTTTTTIDKATLKGLIIQLFEEDKDFLHKIVSLFQAEATPKKKKLPQDMNDEEHAEFMKEMERKYANKLEDFEPLKELFKDEELSAEEIVKML